MASTYTVNLGIEKIGTGEQSGTWGTTTNTNFDLIDQAINGAVTVTLASAGTSGVPNTLAITDGAVSDGRNKFIDFADGGDLGAAAYIQLTPNDAEKLVHIRNSLSGGRSIFVFQGTYNASNDFEIPNGKDVVLKFDGGGATATVTQVFEDLLVTAVAATTVDTTNIEVTNLKAKDGTSAGSIADSTGVVTLASSVLTTTDINGGSVDGVTLGTNSAVTEAQIDNININGNTISSTDTNGNVTITPDGTGSVAITKIDVAGGEIDGTAIGANSASTAVFTDLTASGTVSFSGATVSDGGTVTTVNIDGGNIDGTIIGAASTAAGSFTTGQFDTSLNVDGTVTADGLTIDGAVAFNASNVSLDNSYYLSWRNNANTLDITNITFDSTDTLVIDPNRYGTVIGTSANPSFKVASNRDISFYEDTGTTPKFFWDASAESLGIGTSVPVNLLHLVKAAPASVPAAGASGHALAVGTSPYGLAGGTLSNGNSYLQSTRWDGTATNYNLLLQPNGGNVGIGTTSPAEELHIEANYPQLRIASNLNVLGSNNLVSTVDGYATNGLAWRIGRVFGSADLQINNERASATVFTTDATERMRISSAGDVGIGTTSLSASAGYSTLSLNGSTGGQLAFQTGGTGKQYIYSTSTDLNIYNSVAGNLIFHTSGSERARIDSSGNVGIGTTSPAKTLDVNGEMQADIYRYPNANVGGIFDISGSNGIEFYGSTNAGADKLIAYTGGSERMRVDSNGFLNIGVSTAISSSTNTSDGFTFAPSGGYAWLSVSDTGGIYVQRQNDNSVFSFYRGSSNVGSISVTSSATAYNTSSDQRLKDNIVDAPSASDDIDAIQVRSFDWKADGSHQRYGMVAQELMTVAPEAVSGDPESDDMMGVDYSKLVPMLVKEIQSLRARVHALESK